MVPKRLLAEVLKKSNKTFLVCSHVSPEGDALGSELAIADLLRSKGKKVILFSADSIPQEYGFLPGIKSIKQKLQPVDYDVAILVDCSDISRIGKVQKILSPNKIIINIDHHISNSKFGDINWVMPYVSCASEMVYELYKALKVKIGVNSAVCLYTGILTDTGSFKYKTTSWRTHMIVSELLKCGLDVYTIYRNIYESFSKETVRALGKIIGTLSVSRDGKVAWLTMRNNLIRSNPVLAEQTDSIIHFPRIISGVEIALLFKELKLNDEVRINFRSTGRADVNKLARVFGGGGHSMASGATLRGPFFATVKKVIIEAKKRVK